MKASERAHHLLLRRRWAVLGAGAAAVLAVTGVVALLLRPDSRAGATPPAAVSHVDTAARACLLTSTDTDTTGTWAAMEEMAGMSDTNVVVQRYSLPASADTVAYVNALVQLRCSTVVTTGEAARSAVVSRLAAGHVPRVRFVVVADRPLTGATHLSPVAVSARALSRMVIG